MTDLAEYIRTAPLANTHDHQRPESDFVARPLDVLQQLFDGGYISADLISAGAAPDDVQRLLDPQAGDIRRRFLAVADAWEACRFTGYGEAVRTLARDVFGIDELTPDALEAAQARQQQPPPAGERLRILRDMAGLTHTQVDDFVARCAPDPSGPDFFLPDLSWLGPCSGAPDLAALLADTGVTVTDLPSLRQACEATFARFAPLAIAVKAQHAYVRTLAWQPRSDADAAAALQKLLANRDYGEADRLCLGDWCWARGVELASEHGLPFKLHTGYHAGHSGMQMEWIRPALLSPLLKAHPQARFVLMHAGYPYGHELLALAKHYPNVHIDLCWAWSLDPYTTADFVRRAIHSVPANKVFAFGGDSGWPYATLSYAAQARHWLHEALAAEVRDGYLGERDALALAARLMHGNASVCFDITGRQANLRAAAAAAA